MAIKQATTTVVDPSAYEYLAVQSSGKVANRETGEVKIDRATGLRVWSVDCLRTELATGTIATIAVSVPSKDEPKVAGLPVLFTNLTAMQWATDSGSGLAFRADAVAPTASRASSSKGAA